jgi:hypothetical protein
VRREVRDLWTAALRSGRYEQTTGKLTRLDDDDGQPMACCCLGVLCEVALEAGVELNLFSSEYGTRYYDHEDNFLPDRVRNWAGLNTGDPEVTRTRVDDTPVTSSLSFVNDEVRLSFERIADLIEEQL